MRQIGMVLIALACGLVATIAVSQVMKNNETEQAAPVTEPIYVAVTDVNINDQLSAEKVRLEEWPADRIPLGAIRDIADLDGRFAKQNMFPGEPVLSLKLMDGKDGSANEIPEGFRATSIKVTMETAVASLIKPGDHVDIIAFLRKGIDIPQTTSKTILRDVRVFAVNSETTRQVDAEGVVSSAKTVSLLVRPNQVEMINLAGQLGKLQLSLRRPDEENNEPNNETTVEDLLRGGGDIVSNQKLSGFLSSLFTRPAASPEAPIAAPMLGADTNFVMTMIMPDGVVQYRWSDESELPVMVGVEPETNIVTPSSAPSNSPLSGAPAPAPGADAGGGTDEGPSMPADPLKGADMNNDLLRQLLNQ